MKSLYRWSVWLALASFFYACTPAAAQWQTPDHSVPIGRGSGTGFKFAAPGAAGQGLLSNGAGADPSFQSLTNGFGTQPANTVLAGPPSGTPGPVSFRPLTTADIPSVTGQTYNPIAYGAVGDGVTDDTAAWQSMCSAINTAGSGWIISPSGKTYLIFSAQSGINQTALCSLTNVSGFRVDMNGSSFKSAYASQINIGGTATASDVLTAVFTSLFGTFAAQTVTYTVPSGATTTAQMATGLAAAINANATLAANAIAATATGSVVNITPTGNQITWYIGQANGNPGLSVSGSKTETMQTTITYGFLLANSQNIEINDLRGTAISGYADSARGGSMQWVFCSNVGAPSGFSCRNADVNRMNVNGGFNGVAIVRTLGTGTWGYNIRVNGSVSNVGYPLSNQNDGLNTTFDIVAQDIGRSYIGYNVHGVKGRVNTTRSNFSVGLNDIEIGAYGFGSTGIGTDISQNMTTGIDIKYINRFSSKYGSSFVALSHQQGDPNPAHTNIPTYIQDININFDVYLNGNPSTVVWAENTFTGYGGNQTFGDLANLNQNIVISGTIQSSLNTTYGGCFLSATNGLCQGFSGLSAGNYTIRDMTADNVRWAFGVNAKVVFDNYNSATNFYTQDAGAAADNIAFHAPVVFSGAGFSAGGKSCGPGTPSASFTVSHGIITAC